LPLYYNKLRGKSTFCLSGKARALAIGKERLTIILFIEIKKIMRLFPHI